MFYKTRSKAGKDTIEDTNSVLFEYTSRTVASEVITVTQHDSLQLQSPNYLNDTIVNFLLQYYLDNSVDELLKKKAHVFSSLLMPKIKSYYKQDSNIDKIDTSANNGDCMLKWLNGVKIFDKDFLFLPISQDNNWLLVIICYPRQQPSLSTEKKTDEELFEPAVFVLNSIKSPAVGVKKALQKFLANQWKVERGSERTFAVNQAKSNGIRLMFPQVPQQKNNYNCGVYLLNYFKCFLNAPRESYIKMFRQRDLLNWFDENGIRVQSSRSQMIEIVRKQSKLWMQSENKADDGAAKRENSYDIQGSQMSCTMIELK